MYFFIIFLYSFILLINAIFNNFDVWKYHLSRYRIYENGLQC